jgi:hypothetical protein
MESEGYSLAAIIINIFIFTYQYKLLHLIIIFLTFKVIASTQKCKIQFYYNKKSKYWTDFLANTSIASHEYTPYAFALHGHMQSALYLILEIRMKFFFPIKYERELFKLSDGGTIALDWSID